MSDVQSDTTSEPVADTSSADPTAEVKVEATAEPAKTETASADAAPAYPSKDTAKPSAPESYDFKSPEGFDVSPDVVSAYAGVAKELGLSQEAAQSILEKMTPILSNQNVQLLEGAVVQWKTAQKADKEYGGDKLDENLSVAKKALDAFGTPELIELLDQSKLRDHPEVIRAFYRVGKQLSEDSIVRGTVKAAEQSDITASMYAKTREQLKGVK